MQKFEYLLYAVQQKAYLNLDWIISAFTFTQPNSNKIENPYPGQLVREPFGVFYYDENKERQPIEVKDPKPNQPLFNKYEAVSITKAALPIITGEKIETTISRLLLNLLVIYEPFYGRLSYINQPFTPSDVEKLIAPKLKDTLKEGEKKVDGVFYTDEYIRFSKAVTFIEQLSKIFAQSVRKAGLLPPPGIKEFKQQLLKKYEGKLRDPGEMVKFQAELNAYDKAYLEKNDTSYGKFMAGQKIIGARSKSWLTQGGEGNSFIDQLDIVPITQPLTEGIDFDPEKFMSICNTIRYGSFAKGAETVNGGVVAKALMVALDTWRIIPGDCTTKFSAKRFYTEKEASLLIGVYVIANDKPLLIETIDQAKQYVNREIKVRSPQYCRRPGTETCSVCAGKDLARFPNGLVIPAMEVSSGIMSDSLKKMHQTNAQTRSMDLTLVIS